MSERKKEQVRNQSYGVFKDAETGHGFRPKANVENIVELRKKVNSDRDARMLTSYLLARDTLRSLQKFRDELGKHGLTDTQKTARVNAVVLKILKGS